MPYNSRQSASEESLEVVLKKWTNKPPPAAPPVREEDEDDYSMEDSDDESGLEQDVVKGISSFKEREVRRQNSNSSVRGKVFPKYRCHLIVLFFLLALIVLFTCLGVFKPWEKSATTSSLTDGDAGDDGVQIYTLSPLASPLDMVEKNKVKLMNLLIDVTSPDLLQDDSSPQAQAVQRLAKDSADAEIDTNDSASNNEIVQKYALLTFFYASGGDDWLITDGWSGNSSESVDICDWHGLKCDTAKNNVRSRNLQDGSMVFSSVTSINLATNNLQGSIPREICALNYTTRLDMQKNFLTGRIPGCISRMTNMTHLKLNSNSLTGEIPNGMYKLTQLKELLLNSNSLNGTLSAKSDQWEDLKVLRMYKNSLAGPLPIRIGKWLKMEEFQIQNNKLTGSIPDKITRLTLLKKLDMSVNGLTGTIPTKFGRMDLLVWIYLNDNKLAGTIPTELGNLADLERLDLENNKFDPDSSVPSNLCPLVQSNDLQISADCKTALKCECCKKCV